MSAKNGQKLLPLLLKYAEHSSYYEVVFFFFFGRVVSRHGRERENGLSHSRSGKNELSHSRFFPRVPFPISRPSLILLLKSYRNCQIFYGFFSCELATQRVRANMYFQSTKILLI